MKKLNGFKWIIVMAIAISIQQYAFSQTDGEPGPLPTDQCIEPTIGCGAINNLPLWITTKRIDKSIVSQYSDASGIMVKGLLEVNGNCKFHVDVAVDNSFNVYGPSYLKNLNIEGDLNALGYSYFGKSVGMHDALTVDGQAYFNKVNIQDDLNILGYTYFAKSVGMNEGLTVDGQTYLNKVNIQDNVNILGYSYFAKSVGMHDCLTIDHDLTTLGNTSIAGNLYIGTGSTNYHQLLINGSIVAKEVEVTLTGWKDEVFNKDYKLLPLADVENYILKEKHLPDVPSETDVLANGIKVGEMNATLLQKVEELTLYVIQLKKEIDSLKKSSR
jgi:hypothetical protein